MFGETVVESWRRYEASANSVKGEMDSMGASRLALRVRADSVVSSVFKVVATCVRVAAIVCCPRFKRLTKISNSTIILIESSYLAHSQSFLSMMIGVSPATACPNCDLTDLNLRFSYRLDSSHHSSLNCAILVANVCSSLDSSAVTDRNHHAPPLPILNGWVCVENDAVPWAHGCLLTRLPSPSRFPDFLGVFLIGYYSLIIKKPGHSVRLSKQKPGHSRVPPS